jgi:hypothetical protein
MKWIEENGCEVLNGNKQGDEEGEWTHIISREETVIDYGIVNEEPWEGVEKFRIEKRALRKRREGKEQRRKGVGNRNKTVYCYFFVIAVFCLEKFVIRNRKAPRASTITAKYLCNSTWVLVLINRTNFKSIEFRK